MNLKKQLATEITEFSEENQEDGDQIAVTFRVRQRNVRKPLPLCVLCTLWGINDLCGFN